MRAANNSGQGGMEGHNEHGKPRRQSQDMWQGFLEEAPPDLGQEARFRRVKKWGHGNPEQGRRGAGASKVQVKCPCLTTALAQRPPGL